MHTHALHLFHLAVPESLLLFNCSVLSDSLRPPWTSMPGFPVLYHLLGLAQTHVHWVGNAIQPSLSSSVLYHPLLLPSIFPSIRVFSNESALCIRWPKCLSFSFSISPANEYSGLTSFRIDWFDLLAVQGTQESSPTRQFKSINSSALSLLYGPTLTSIYDFLNCTPFYYTRGFPGGASGKESPANLGDIRDLGSIPGSGRSLGVGNGNPLQYSYLESSMSRGAWWATVPVATKIWTQLSKRHFHFHCLLNQ